MTAPANAAPDRQADRRHGAWQADLQGLCDALARWSLHGDLAGLRGCARHDEPLPEGLRAEGHVAIGPCRLPLRWLHDRADYQRALRQVQQQVRQGPPSARPTFEPKVAGELEPLLAMWPHVLAVPTAHALSIEDLVMLRAFPLHPLGVVDGPKHADGLDCTPAEFFAHDLDHARYKIRADLLVQGVAVPDPYDGGSTLDPATGAHRQVLCAAVAHAGPQGWARAGTRLAWLRSVWQASRATADPALGTAAQWLLFELLHEKSLPLHGPTLAAELAAGAHVRKLQAKVQRRFFGRHAPPERVVAQWPAAGTWLQAWMSGLP